ncbi:MAG: hypothetical protein L3J74_05710 [Bacteroidales bacterium]|nr:hypothetical protein [Bacteroidales bacterium]
MNQESKFLLIDEVFTPSSPIENAELFTGREQQIAAIKEAVREKGQHAIMHGLRGAGKTSLANMTLYLFQNLMSIKITCNREDSFNSIWERALRKIRFAENNKTIGFISSSRTEIFPIEVPPQNMISATEVEQILLSINGNMLFIFDEFDMIKSKKVKSQMADMIKLVSDNLPHVSILIVGIAESVDELIGEHPSIERCMKQIELPLMNDNEAKDMVLRNLSYLKMNIDEHVLLKIVDMASGFPNYLHLLCKYAAKAAVRENNVQIAVKHFDEAVIKSIENSDYTIKKTYAAAVKSASTKNRFADVLLACALAEADETNSFDAYDVLEKYNRITGAYYKKEQLHYNLGMLCKKERAEILTKTRKSKTTRYKFSKPLIKAFVKLKQHEEQLK